MPRELRKTTPPMRTQQHLKLRLHILARFPPGSFRKGSVRRGTAIFFRAFDLLQRGGAVPRHDLSRHLAHALDLSVEAASKEISRWVSWGVLVEVP